MHPYRSCDKCCPYIIRPDWSSDGHADGLVSRVRQLGVTRFPSSWSMSQRPISSESPCCVACVFLRSSTDTMSSRVSKSKLKTSSSDRRNAQVLLIDTLGFETMPCSFCQQRGMRCMMVTGVSRCRECTRRGRSCDGSGISVAAGTFCRDRIFLVLTCG